MSAHRAPHAVELPIRRGETALAQSPGPVPLAWTLGHERSRMYIAPLAIVPGKRYLVENFVNLELEDNRCLMRTRSAFFVAAGFGGFRYESAEIEREGCAHAQPTLRAAGGARIKKPGADSRQRKPGSPGLRTHKKTDLGQARDRRNSRISISRVN